MSTLSRIRWRQPVWLGLAAVVVLAAVGVVLTRIMETDFRRRSRLVNVSLRAFAGPGDQAMSAGFIIDEHSQTMVLRVRGPSLAQHGVAHPLTDPRLRIIRYSDGAEVGVNDSWRSPGNERLEHDLAGFAPPDPREPACVVTLRSGSYAAVIESADGSAGVAMLELFTVLD